MKNSLSKLLLVVATTVLLGACASTTYDGATFLKPAEDISSAWVAPDGDIYMVPQKGVVVDNVVDQNGANIEWKTVGSYISISASGIVGINSIWIVIEGKQRQLRIPSPKN